MPGHETAGTYIVTPFCPSVLPDSVSAHTWTFSIDVHDVDVS